MNTDTITDSLFKQAIDIEEKRLQDAAETYNRTIGLSGTCSEITLTSRDGKTELKILTSEIYKAITGQLLAEREERLKTNAVNDFLNKFKAFSGYMHQMENYGS